MEFVIVLPLYILLFGVTFAIGEMSLKAICLASGDRLGAFSIGGGNSLLIKTYLQSKLFAMNAKNLVAYSDDIRVATFSDRVDFNGLRTYRREDNFEGAWSWLAAATTENQYALPPWTRGWLQYPNLVFDKALGTSSSVGSGAEELLASGRLGRTSMYSKDISPRVRAYNYYCLMRTESGRKSYRSWDAGNLAKSSFFPVSQSVWKTSVNDEPMVYDSSDGCASLDQYGKRLDPNQPPAKPGKRKDYKRYEQFVLWSQ